MNGLIYRWRFADSRGYIKCGRKQEILETIWIAGHSKRKKSAAWVGIPAHSLSGSVFLGWWGPIFFFPAEWKFPGCCGAVAGRMLMAEPCPWPRVGGSAVTVVVTVLAAITVVRWLLLPSSLSWFSTVSISHMRAEKRSLLVPNPPALRPRRPCLICWHLASPGNILPTYFSRIFLKSSAS